MRFIFVISFLFIFGISESRCQTDLSFAKMPFNSELLTNAIYDHLEFQIFWVEGSKPNKQIIDAFLRAAEKIVDKEIRISTLEGEEIRKESPEDLSRNVYNLFTQSFSKWNLPERTLRVELVFLPFFLGDGFHSGTYQQWVIKENGSLRLFPVISVLFENDKKNNLNVDEAVGVLFHELSHLIGFWGNGPANGLGHCPSRKCIMNSVVSTSTIRNVAKEMKFSGPPGFCSTCLFEFSRFKESLKKLSPDDRKKYVLRDRDCRVFSGFFTFYFERGQFEKAVENARLALSFSNQKNAFLYYNLGLGLLNGGGKASEAISAFHQAEKLGMPRDDLDLVVQLALALLKSHKYHEASQYANQLKGGGAFEYEIKAWTAAGLGRECEAALNLLKASRKSQGWRSEKYLLESARLFDQCGKTKKAKKIISEGLKEKSGDPEIIAEKIRFAVKENQKSEAMELVKSLENEKTPSARQLYYLALSYSMLNGKGKSQIILKRLNETFPDSYKNQAFFLAPIYQLNGESQLAKNSLKQVDFDKFLPRMEFDFCLVRAFQLVDPESFEQQCPNWANIIKH